MLRNILSYKNPPLKSKGFSWEMIGKLRIKKGSFLKESFYRVLYLKWIRMDEEPIISFKGRNGKIELHKTFLRLDRGTMMGFLMQGLKGKKDIYFRSISSIQIKKPGLSVGYLQLSISGGHESRKGLFASVKDENTITFDGREKYEKALKIKEYIENKIVSGNPDSTSSADEIEKLHSLMKKKIITKEEFEIKKKKLLDNI